MKDRLPSLSIFVGDYVGSISVHLMPLAERGAYVHLLCLNWQDGRLQKDPNKLRNERRPETGPSRLVLQRSTRLLRP